MAKIAFFEVENWEDEYFRKNLRGFDLTFSENILSQENINQTKDAEVLSIFIYSEITPEIIDRLPNLKCIITRSTGFDHIDIDYCAKKGIDVLNIPAYGVNSVSEHTFALILAISRKIIPSAERTKRGDFSQDDLSGFDLYGKTLGVIGAGRIGKRVIEIGQAFGMRVLVFTKHPNPSIENVEDVSFEELLSRSDIVSLHIPYTKETHHMINLGNINKLKRGSILINTARGAIIETQAILEGLDKGIFKAVGLDVLEEESELREEKELLTRDFLKKANLKTLLLDHVLIAKENVIITPHSAFNSKESLDEILKTTCENIKSWKDGKTQNKVN